jgi:RNA polymerase sigma-70 factor (ECF subfamily)
MDAAQLETPLLVERARQGDFEAFDQLVTRFERRIYTLALRIVKSPEDAQEVVQETFLSALQNIQGFRGDARFSTWLIRIATNHALKILRKKHRYTEVPIEDSPSGEEDTPLPRPEYIADWKDTPAQIAARQEAGRILEQALESLEEKYRLVFLLRDVEGMSTADTAQSLGITKANVKVRLLRARLMLREQLTRIFGEPPGKVLDPHDHQHKADENL